MDVKIWNPDPMKLAYVEHIGPYQEVAGAWDKLRSEACITLTREIAATGDLVVYASEIIWRTYNNLMYNHQPQNFAVGDLISPATSFLMKTDV